MLIEFSVSNFRSFREKQTLSMVAAPKLTKEPNTFAVTVAGESLPRLLKVAAIYGPNASGKSNLVGAIDAVRALARHEPTANPTPLPVSAFRFDPDLRAEPSRFQIHFVESGARYRLDVAATQSHIVEERLTIFSDGEPQLLFERVRNGDAENYVFGDALEGGTELHKIWQKATSPNTLFLSRAVANSSQELQQLRRPFRWLSDGLVVVRDDMNAWQKSVRSLLERHESIRGDVVRLLQEVDVPVSQIRTEPIQQADTAGETQPRGLGAATMSRRKTTLTHETALGSAEFDFQEESEGTKNLIGFSLPWGLLQNDIDIFRTDALVVDEFDSSLHPSIVAALVKRHLERDDPKQLIFTTHDTHLMDAKLLRRDQFWLTERDANGATQLRSIHEYKGREGEDIEKRYYEGRYRGLPNLRSVS
jgi:hypothetical protein